MQTSEEGRNARNNKVYMQHESRMRFREQIQPHTEVFAIA